MRNELLWTHTVDHPMQNKTMCMDALRSVSQGKVESFYDTIRTMRRDFYILHIRNALIHPAGIAAWDCGYYLGSDGCESRFGMATDWWNGCRGFLTQSSLSLHHLFNSTAVLHPRDATSRPLKKLSVNTTLLYHHCGHNSKPINEYDKVFVISALWDYNYYHFVIDSLARMIRHIKFLRKNQDIMIHIHAFEEYDGNQEMHGSKTYRDGVYRMRNRLFQLLGINLNRIISGPVLARAVYLPRFIHCAQSISNALEIRLLADELLHQAFNQLRQVPPDYLRATNHSGGPAMGVKEASQHRYTHFPISPEVKNLVILQRYATHGDSDRQWGNETTATIAAAFRDRFPDHNVLIKNSYSSGLDNYCLACDLVDFSRTDILVAAHGAGMTNLMFMPPGGLVVEMVGEFKDVNFPLCGYYGSMAAIVGLHHFLYTYNFYDSQGKKAYLKLNPLEAAAGARGFFNYLRNNNTSSKYGGLWNNSIGRI